ncbi:hypothetical protein CSAL01_04857 [Colletotrichum salicis]|uniref:Uncharacterized protein n=1 Tax=Colletotrichum salicis TaxID=1209931 RepID=A0A135V6J5_9PEZI|nr:hypothetical protein CSAL01_04857 [Colletotrichum salicis]
MEVLASSISQNQREKCDVSEGAEQTTEAQTSSKDLMNDLFDLLWLAFDNGQAIQGVLNVEDAVFSRGVEFVVWAESTALRRRDILAGLVEDRVRELCHQQEIATLTIPSMYELGHACGFNYSVSVAAVTVQERSELMESIEDMKAKFRRLRRLSANFQVEGYSCTENLGAKPEDLQAGEPIRTDSFESMSSLSDDYFADPLLIRTGSWGSLSSISGYDSDDEEPLFTDGLEATSEVVGKSASKI